MGLVDHRGIVVVGLGSFHFVEELTRFPRNDRVSTTYSDNMNVDDTACDSTEMPIDSINLVLFIENTFQRDLLEGLVR